MNMSQRQGDHPYMSKTQLNEYLASLRNGSHYESQALEAEQTSNDESNGRGSTPLLRALKERYGSGNVTAGYIDIGAAKKGESPTKRALPPVPGPKSQDASGWRVTKGNDHQQKQETNQDKLPYRQDAHTDAGDRNDFWTTGIARPFSLASKTGGQQSSPPDPRDDLRIPTISALPVNERNTSPLPVGVPGSGPSLSTPKINAPSNVASINVPLSSLETIPAVGSNPLRSWPNIRVRSESSSALSCAVCSRPISGRIVTAVGQRFHPECFRCDKCYTELEHVAFYEHEGKVYCHLDYHELFSPRCKHCGTPIENEVISALGNKYHPGHFFCAGCGDPFGATTPFIVRDKYPWCEKCYENKYAPKCAKCRKPIPDEVLNAMGKSWHPSGCFVCKECGRDFGDDGFFIDSVDNRPLCKPCKHLKILKQVEKIRA